MSVTGWDDGGPGMIAKDIELMERTITSSLDEAALAGAQALASELQKSAPVADEPHHGQGPGRLAGSFSKVGIAPARFRSGASQYQGLARIGPMKFWGPMLEAGRSAGTSKSGHKYPGMRARPFIHRTVRRSSRRIRQAIEAHLPDIKGLELGRKTTRRGQ